MLLLVSPGAAEVRHDAKNVPLLRLIAAPEQFDGVLIRTIVFFRPLSAFAFAAWRPVLEARGHQRFMSTKVVWATGAGEERQIDRAQATVGGQGAETSGHPVAITGPTAGVVDVAADAAWQRQANRQRGVRSDGFETSGHCLASRAGNLSREHRRGVELASRADANRRRRNEAGQ